MKWFWMNIPLAAVIFAITTGVPLWLVLKHPDTGSEPAPDAPPQAQPDGSPGPFAADTYRPRHASSSDQLAGAPR
jgi:hypothetical protein